MAPESKELLTTKAELVASLDQARSRLPGELRALGHSINPASRLRYSLQRHRAGWILGSLAGGFLGTRLLLASRRRRKARGKGSTPESRRLGILPVMAFLLKYGLSLSRPAAAKFLEKSVVRIIDPKPEEAGKL